MDFWWGIYDPVIYADKEDGNFFVCVFVIKVDRMYMWTEEKMIQEENFETDRRLAHTFQILHGNQQRWHA